jgi:hypothetical protein
MSDAIAHEGTENQALSAGDLIICMLGALVAAGVAWSVVFGLFAGANYGLTYFQIAVPDLALQALDISSKVLPALAALIAGWIGYRFLIKLP